MAFSLANALSGVVHLILEFALSGILAWTTSLGEVIVEYVMEVKSVLADALWDRLASDESLVTESGEGVLSVEVSPLLLNENGERYKFFKVWAIVETLNSYG